MIEISETNTLIIMSKKTDNLKYEFISHNIDYNQFKTNTTSFIADIKTIIHLALNISKNLINEVSNRPDQIHNEHIIDIIETLIVLKEYERIDNIMRYKNEYCDVNDEVQIFF